MTALPSRMTVDLAYLLIFGAFAALVLNAMFGPLAALTFMGCGGLLIVSTGGSCCCCPPIAC
jgi:exopolysaccharide production protein ExoQ